MSTPGLNYSNAEALHEGVASHRVLEKAQFDYRTVGILGDSIPQTHPRIREGWDIENKYSLAKRIKWINEHTFEIHFFSM